jgi:hypothetical protein
MLDENVPDCQLQLQPFREVYVQLRVTESVQGRKWENLQDDETFFFFSKKDSAQGSRVVQLFSILKNTNFPQ